MRNVITRIMVIVAAMVMRPTTQARPGYGASSVLRNCRTTRSHRPMSWVARREAGLDPGPHLTAGRSTAMTFVTPIREAGRVWLGAFRQLARLVPGSGISSSNLLSSSR